MPQNTDPFVLAKPNNRPPMIIARESEPSVAVVELNLRCPEETGVFAVSVLDLDIDQKLEVRWFLDYDLAGLNEDRPIVSTQAGLSGTAQRPRIELDPIRIKNEAPSIDRPHTLEVFIVESDALEPDSTVVPVDKALKNCEALEFPDDCVISLPATFRWTLDVKDEQCGA